MTALDWYIVASMAFAPILLFTTWAQWYDKRFWQKEAMGLLAACEDVEKELRCAVNCMCDDCDTKWQIANDPEWKKS